MPSTVKAGDRLVTLIMGPEMLKRVEAFMRDQELMQRSQAIRVLVSRALKAEGK